MNNANKWVMNRAGIINFWYYDEQYFDFSDGKILLRGSNGSGKSVTMQSLLPTLLDGKTDPTRLDSFRSRSRKMEDYLLGEEQVSNIQERTGYLFLEFKRKEQDSFLTVGMGLQAKRGGVLNKWYFGITDGRRIGINFSLFEELKGEHLQPLSKRQLINRLADGGKVMASQKEYQEFVNERIFGFNSPSEFEDCIKLLMELRSPKLSREYNPTAIYDILTNALPALKEDDLQPVSRTLEQIDSSRDRLAQFERESAAVGKINQSYSKMYEEKLRHLANRWLENDQTTQVKETRIAHETAQQQELVLTLEELGKEQAELEMNLALWRKEQDDLKENEAYQLIEKGAKLKEILVRSSQQLMKNEEKVNKKEVQASDTHNVLDDLSLRFERLEKELASLADEMAEHAEVSGYLPEHEQHLADCYRKGTDHSFDYWKMKNREYLKHVRDMIAVFKELKTIQESQKRIDKELGDVSQELETQRKHARHWQSTFMDEKEKVISAFSAWHEKAHFIVPQASYGEVLRRVEGLYAETIRYSFVTEPIYVASTYEKQRISNALLPIRSAREQITTDIEKMGEEIQAWKTEKDPIPYRTEASQRYRQQLIERQITAEPFYACIDFKDDVTEEKRNAIESALLEAGLLDALLSKETLALAGDRQLQPNPQFFSQTLADYLIPDRTAQTIDSGYVQDVLQTIEVVDSGNSETVAPIIAEDGSYRLFSLKGKADDTYQASFIGKSSKERFRAEKIKYLEEEIDQLQVEFVMLGEKEDTLDGVMKEIDTDLTLLPRDTDLEFAHNNIVMLQQEISRLENNLERKQRDLQEARKKVDTLKIKLRQMAQQDVISFTLSAYEDAEKAQEDYQSTFHDWTGKMQDRIYVSGNKEDAKSRLAVQREELQDLLEDYDDEAARNHSLKKQIESNLELQKMNNAADITARIESCIANIDSGQRRNRAIQKEELDFTNQLTKLKGSLDALNESILFERPYTFLWRETLEKELARYGRDKNRSLKEIAAEMIVDWNSQENQMPQLEGNLDGMYRQTESDLFDYNPRIIQEHVLTEPSWFGDFEPVRFGDKMDVWRHTNQIKLFQVNSEGAWRSPYDLKEHLEDQIEQSKLVLQRSDEELFEQIIFHSVGRVLRSLIKNAQRWVIQMNDILEQQDNSSGLTLSIKWKPKAAESNEVLSTAQLIELLRKDANLLKESDSELIKHHFQERINQAKLLRDESNGEDSLYQVLQEVLDYRKWFSFELYYHRKNEIMRELTNNKFNQFSGGEKAIAMYLPLFTAMYSRYQDASDDAPYIITLDEAFAGIDDLNIAELFKATEQLEFNYMMNSQALYGEYKTVSSLNTYELIRPKNAPIVSTIQYHWDGKVKTLVLPEENGQE